MAKELKVGLNITADGKQAVDEIGRVTDAIGDIGLAGPDLDQIIDAFKGVDAAAKNTAPDIEKVEDALTKAFKATGARSSAAIQEEINKIRNSLSMMAASAKVSGQEYDRAFSAGIKKIQELEAEMAGLEKQTKKVEVSAGSLATGLKALAGAAVVKEFISANASLESMEMALEAISGSSEEAAREMAFVRSEANRLGIEVNGAANSYVQFTAASKGTALEGEQTKEIWSAIAERMSRLGRSSEETSGALNAVSQMMSKGQVMAEELRGQLGERLPGAFQISARAMGVTTAELGKMLESGQVVATDFLPKFAAELRNTGGDAGDINTFNANLGRMKNALNDAATTIGDTGIFQALSTATRAAAFGVTLLVSEFVLLGKTLGNVAYTVSSLDFSGFMTRQNALIEETKAKLAQAEKQILGTGEAAEVAGKKASTGFVAMAEGAKEAEKEIKGSVKVVNELVSAYEKLGLKSQIELDMTAKAAKNAYETIVRMGAPINDQNAAWGKWAEAAIAANGGVASSTLQAEAAQHGLTIAIEETGKAGVRTLDVLERLKSLQQEQQTENTRQMEQQSANMARLRTETYGFTGTMEDSITGFISHVSGLGDGLASVINNARQEMAALSQAALDMYMSMDFGNAGESIGMFLDDVARNTAYVTTLFNQQAEVAEYWRQRLADGVDTAGDLTTATQVLGSQLTILGNEQLDPLRNAIADAERRMLDLRDAAQSTLDSIQDEWDQLNNNLDEIERRRAAKREAELQAQIAAAKASGDKEAIADLAKALDLLKKVTAARITDAKQREKDARNTVAAPVKPTTSGGGGISTKPARSGDTHIHIAGVLDINDKATLDSLGRKLNPILKNIGRLGA